MKKPRYDKWERGGAPEGAWGGGGGGGGGEAAGGARERDRERERQARALQLAAAHAAPAEPVFAKPFRVSSGDRVSQQVQKKMGDYHIAQTIIDDPRQSIGICAEPPSPAPHHHCASSSTSRGTEFKKPQHAAPAPAPAPALHNGRVGPSLHHRAAHHHHPHYTKAGEEGAPRPAPLRLHNGLQLPGGAQAEPMPPLETILREMKTLPAALSALAATPRTEGDNKFVFNPHTNKLQVQEPRAPEREPPPAPAPAPSPAPAPPPLRHGADGRISSSQAAPSPTACAEPALSDSEEEPPVAAHPPSISPLPATGSSSGSSQSDSESDTSSDEEAPAPPAAPAPTAPAPPPPRPDLERPSWSLSIFAHPAHAPAPPPAAPPPGAPPRPPRPPPRARARAPSRRAAARRAPQPAPHARAPRLVRLRQGGGAGARRHQAETESHLGHVGLGGVVRRGASAAPPPARRARPAPGLQRRGRVAPPALAAASRTQARSTAQEQRARDERLRAAPEEAARAPAQAQAALAAVARRLGRERRGAARLRARGQEEPHHPQGVPSAKGGRGRRQGGEGRQGGQGQGAGDHRVVGAGVGRGRRARARAVRRPGRAARSGPAGGAAGGRGGGGGARAAVAPARRDAGTAAAPQAHQLGVVVRAGARAGLLLVPGARGDGVGVRGARPPALPARGDGAAARGRARSGAAVPRNAVPGIGAVLRAHRTRAGARTRLQKGVQRVPRDHRVHKADSPDAVALPHLAPLGLHQARHPQLARAGAAVPAHVQDVQARGEGVQQDRAGLPAEARQRGVGVAAVAHAVAGRLGGLGGVGRVGVLGLRLGAHAHGAQRAGRGAPRAAAAHQVLHLPVRGARPVGAGGLAVSPPRQHPLLHLGRPRLRPAHALLHLPPPGAVRAPRHTDAQSGAARLATPARDSRPIFTCTVSECRLHSEPSWNFFYICRTNVF